MNSLYCVQVSAHSGMSYVSGFSINYSGGRIIVNTVSTPACALKFTDSEAANNVVKTLKKIGYKRAYVIPIQALTEAA